MPQATVNVATPIAIPDNMPTATAVDSPNTGSLHVHGINAVRNAGILFGARLHREVDGDGRSGVNPMRSALE
jgi:hypothetical protein